MTKNEELKACPCCEASADFIEITDDDNENFGAKFIECRKCGMTTPMVFQCMEGAEEKLLQIWNTRPTITPTDGDAEKALDAVSCYLEVGFPTAGSVLFIFGDTIKAALQTRTPPVPVDTINIKKEVLQGVRDAVAWYAGDGKNRDFRVVDDKGSYLADFKMLGDRAKEALAILDAVLAGGSK